MLEAAYGNIFESQLLEELVVEGVVVDFAEADVLMDIGKYIKSMPLLLSGAIKIMREDKDAGELLLYFIERGNTCAMSLACCMGRKKSEIRAVAENAGQLIMVPVEKMEDWMGRYKSWRNFVFESYHNRFNELLAAVDSIAFNNMDERLQKYLAELAKVNGSSTINKTHQEIANELNSSRVVVSRLLKVLENQHKIQLNRNTIELLF